MTSFHLALFFEMWSSTKGGVNKDKLGPIVEEIYHCESLVLEMRVVFSSLSIGIRRASGPN